MRVALVHDWLTGMRGGEKCLEVFCELFPRATLFTLVHRRGELSPTIEAMEIRTSFVQRLPGALRSHQKYLPLFPAAVERWDFRGYDLVLSTSHCVAKGAIPGPGALHVCYCHTPMRYVWEFFAEYFQGPGAGLATRMIMPVVARRLRAWDVETAPRVHHFIANSRNVAERIRRIYGRKSDVIYPPVDVERFRPETAAGGDGDSPRGAARGGPLLVVSKLVPYKRIDIAVRAAARLGAPLRVVGDGPERRRLTTIAGPDVRFDGWLDDDALADAYRGARALLFPGVEDFGIVPLEAQASGIPVIAFAAGGALETVVDGETGILFSPQTDEALAEAIGRLDAIAREPARARRNAERFSRPRFKDEIRTHLASLVGRDVTSLGPDEGGGALTSFRAAAAGGAVR